MQTTTLIRRTAPPRVLIRLANPVVRMLLRSPLHGMLDPSVLLLHVTGRKTGHEYAIPVNYVDVDGQLIVVTVARWRVNLRDNRNVEVTWRGRRRRMHARLDEEPACVAVMYRQIIDRLGWPKAARQLGISAAGGMAPTLLELKDAASEYGWSVIKLNAR
jgi:deazaflavin-dependent oxidoreductase (nitroreductase family)